MKNNYNYKLLNANMCQQILKQLDNNFNSFFALKKAGYKANIPKYLDKKGFYFICDPQANEHIHIDDKNNSYWTLPLSKLMKSLLKTHYQELGKIYKYDKHHQMNLQCKYNKGFKELGRIHIKMPHILKDKNIKQIKIIPKYNGNYFEIHYIYTNNIKNNIQQNRINQKNNDKNILSIDLGINNFCSCIDTNLNTFIINGKKLKSYNQLYNKTISKLSKLREDQIKWTKQMYSVLNKRNNRVNYFINKTSKMIIDYCLKNNISKIILGYNKNWQKHSNIGKTNNQQFTQIPYNQFKNNLAYRCQNNNIKLILQEESYTSKASFIDNDYIPIYKRICLKKDAYKFSGQRIKRGLYKAKNGIYINADINSSLNIMKKYLISKHEFYSQYMYNLHIYERIQDKVKLVIAHRKDYRNVMNRGGLMAPIRLEVN